NFLLPPVLKRISIVHYLESLCPVPLSKGPLALLSDAPSPWLAVPGLLLLVAALLAFAAWKVRRLGGGYEGEGRTGRWTKPYTSGRAKPDPTSRGSERCLTRSRSPWTSSAPSSEMAASGGSPAARRWTSTRRDGARRMRSAASKRRSPSGSRAVW